MATYIVAICGPSAAGKDTLKNYLCDTFCSLGLYAHKIIQDTSRPPRKNEKDNIDYNFQSEEFFKKNLENYIEYSEFNNWFYGTSKKEIICDTVNIGVFNLQSLEKLISLQRSDYIIIPIYVQTNFFTRLKRSIQRENKISFEIFRRAYSDWKDFKDISLTLKCFPYYFILKGKYNYPLGKKQ